MWSDHGDLCPCTVQVREVCLSESLNGPLLFLDGFELGTTAAWSATVP